MKRTPGVGVDKPRSADPANIALREKSAFARRLRASGVTSTELTRMLNVTFPRASALLGGAILPSGNERARLERYFETGE
jgi:hypothetical protein